MDFFLRNDIMKAEILFYSIIKKTEGTMKLKFIAAVLCLLMLALPLLSACGGSPAPETKGNTLIAETGVKEDPAEVYDQEVKDLQGHEFYFLVRDVTSNHLKLNEVYADALTGDKVNDAVFTRNSQLAEKYHCTIAQELVSSPAATAREILAAGEYVYDFIFTRTTDLRNLSASGLLVDLFKLQNMQFDKAWYNKGFIEGLQIAGHLFYVAGDACTIDDRAAFALFFNRDILQQNRLEDPYQLVEDGTWTVEKLYEMSEKCAVDTNGDGVWTPGSNDVFAYICGKAGDYTHVATCGGLYIADMVGPGEFNIPGMIKEDILNAWSALRPLLTSPHRDISSNGTTFRTGGGAFYAVNLAAIQNWGNVAISYGVIPFPKLNLQQDRYYTCVGNVIDGSFGIPVTVDSMDEADYKNAGFESGREFCAYFFNAFSYYSRQTLTPAFFEEVLKKQMVRDDTAAHMIELLMESKIYDPVYFFNFGSLYNIFNIAATGGGDLVDGTNYDTLTSLYNERYLSARTSLIKYLDVLETIDNENV